MEVESCTFCDIILSEKAKEIEAWVKLSKSPLTACNGALFHVTTRHEHATNESIKATIALKQTVRYQLVDETWETCEHKSGSISSWFLNRFKALRQKRVKITSSTAYLGTNKRWKWHPPNKKSRNSKGTARENARTTLQWLRMISLFGRAVISLPESFGVIARNQVARWTGGNALCS